jgi:hypothetical protein
MIALVMMAKLPSDPRMRRSTSLPMLSRGFTARRKIVPADVTHSTLRTMSSMFPYLRLFVNVPSRLQRKAPNLFFFMPEARVAIHPPRVENSMLSGSWPV